MSGEHIRNSAEEWHRSAAWVSMQRDLFMWHTPIQAKIVAKSLSKVPKASKKIREELNAELDTFLNKLRIAYCFPVVPHDQELYALAKKLGQYEPWKSNISTFDLFSILNQHARRYGLEGSEDNPIHVAAHLGTNQFKKFRDDIHAYLLSIPRIFEISFDLPSMPLWGGGELQLAQNVALIEYAAPPAVDKANNKNNVLAALIGKKEAQTARIALKIRVTGFGSANVNSTAVSNAISQMKQFFQMFRRIEPYKGTVGLLNSDRASEVNCRVIDPIYPSEVMYVQLPAQLRSFLAKVSINENKLEVLDFPNGATLLSAHNRKAETREEKSSALLLSMRWITSVLNCPDNWPDADRIRSALEWGFDSAVNENQTFAFIQACIGIEALLGDDDKDEPLTSRLADRCAYLLGASYKDRDDIRKRFKKMYDVRSKVVHGRRPTLSHSDAQELDYAQEILGDVITAEVNTLLKALGKAKRD